MAAVSKRSRGVQSLVILIGCLGALYAGYRTVFATVWHSKPTLVLLIGLLWIIELYPIRFGKLRYSLAFPLLYTMALVSNFPLASLIGAMILVVYGFLQEQPFRVVCYNSLARLLTLLCTGVVSNWVFSGHSPYRFGSYMIGLAAAIAVYTALSFVFLIFAPQNALERQRKRAALLLIVILNLLFGFGYDGFLIWLALHQRNSGSGVLGTLYFYLPLVAIVVVLHLITNLTRAKSGLETLFSVSQSINRQLELPTVLLQVIHEANRLVHGSCGLLYLRQDDDTLKLEVGTIRPLPIEWLPKGAGIVGAVAETGEATLVHDVELEARYLRRESVADTRSILAVPIQIDGRVAGVISLSKTETHSFDHEDLKIMLIFATHAAVAMKNALFIEEREQRVLLEERNRLAREIHDGLAQDLASALLQIEMIKRLSDRPAEASLNDLQQFLRKTATDVRQSIFSLRPAPYSHVGLIPALRAHLQEVQLETGLVTHFVADPSDIQIPSSVASAIFQIVTESVQNAVKHAQATQLEVKLLREADALCVTIEDNGQGFHFGEAILKAAERHSFGIENLHTIADQIGGALDFQTAPDQGTLITFNLQLEEEHNHVDSGAALR